MSDQTVVHGIHEICTHVNKTAPVQDIHPVCLPQVGRYNFSCSQGIALDDITVSPCEQQDRKNRTNLFDILINLYGILFPRHWEKTFRELEGEANQPIVIYKYVGMNFAQPEVWEPLNKRK